MSSVDIESMTDRLTETLADVADLLGRFAIRIPAPDHMGALDIPAVQHALYRAQGYIENPAYLRSHGVNGVASVHISVMIHEWLAAADQVLLYRDAGSYPWRADTFEQHHMHCRTYVGLVTTQADTGTAWARPVR